MGALLSSLLLLAMPVRPVSQAPRLVADLGAGKPLVLHFWATWCTSCKEEFPRLRAALLALPQRGVAVGLVSIDAPRDRLKAEKMLARYGLARLPAVLLDAPDPDPVAMSVGDPRWDGTLPATFVFDASGKLLRSFIGRTDAHALDEAVLQINHGAH
jgi:thiol-disulfide isomerase/thioredoxin